MKRRTYGGQADPGAVDFSDVGPVDALTSGWVELHLARAVRFWFVVGLAISIAMAFLKGS